MLSCNEICKVLSTFEGEETFKLDYHNPLFEQSPDFSKNYLQLVEDKIKENGWIDPNLEPNKFNELKNNEHQKMESELKKVNDLPDDNNVNNIVNELNNDNMFFNYKEHQTNELPNFLLALIDKSRHNEIYYYGMKGPDSFLASVLLAAEEHYWLQHRKKKKEYADQVKTTFSIQKYDILRGISKESIGHDYLQTIYSNDFPEHVDSDKSKEFRFLIGYHYKINILILELKGKKGYFVTDWKPEQSTLIILFDNQTTYLPILSNKNSSYFTSDEIEIIGKNINILYPIKLNISSITSTSNDDGINNNEAVTPKKGRKKENMISSAEQVQIKTIKVEQIHPITKYQLKDLQDIAEKLNLQLETTKYLADKSMRIIKKTKKDLYEDIINKITNLGN